MFTKIKALIVITILLVTSTLSVCAEDIFFETSEVPFPEDTQTMDLYVCNLLGADSMYLSYRDYNMMVDFGTAGQHEKITNMLDYIGIHEIDYLFNTHPHTDHLGGLESVINFMDSCGQFITGFPLDMHGKSIIQRSRLKIVNEHNIPVRSVTDGDTIDFGDVSIKIIRYENFKTDANIGSLMLHITYGNRSILLSADVGHSTTQYRLTNSNDLKADILKYPHHGLSTLNGEFLAEVAPGFVIFTHGSVNTKTAQAQLDKKNIPYLFATWGIIHFSTDGNVWTWEQLPK